MGGLEGIKGARSEQQSDRAENHHQHGLDLGGFEVQKVRFFIKNAVCLYLKICLPLEREAYFQKNHENKWPESEKWSRKTLDGKCDGYMWGLGFSFSFFENSENQKCAPHPRQEALF